MNKRLALAISGRFKTWRSRCLRITYSIIFVFAKLEPSVSVPGCKKEMTVYSFHFLRHSFACFCAEAGVPKAVLLSILGTESEIADKYYTHVGNEAQEKAIAAISGTVFKNPDKAKIQKALDFIGQVTIPTMESITQLKEILLGA